MQGAVQTTGAESISPRGWKRQTKHVQEAESSVGCRGTEEGELEWAYISGFSAACGERKGRHWGVSVVEET